MAKRRGIPTVKRFSIDGWKTKGYNLYGVHLAPRTVIDGSLILWD